MKKTTKPAKVQASIHEEDIMTYVLREPANLPMFFEKKPYQGATGKLYPLPFIDGITDEKKPCKYQVATLENEYIKVRLLPQIGGKLQQAYDKLNDYDFIYHNHVVKPAMIGLGGPWISGGIEFNWPQHHRPTTFLPVEAHLEEGKDGEQIVWIGETEPFMRTRGIAGVTVCPGRSYIKLQVRIHNPTEVPQPFMWWANLAVPVNDDYQFVFPRDVEYVNDHDRRAVLSWPVAHGIYDTARKYDYHDIDLSVYPNTPVQNSYMVSKGQCDMDFLSGYDHGKNAGIVTIANHHIAPGKKLFHWGKNEFGDQWCRNLTDDDGPYVELMTGVYTDNQPDFTYIMPNETKTFEQYWYPIREIGCVKNASADAAINVEKRDGGVFFGVHATGTFEGCELILFSDGKEIWRQTSDLDPANPLCLTLEQFKDVDEATLGAQVRYNGKLLVDVVPYERGHKKPITPRSIAPRPCEIESQEELYLHGAHLVQYKHHTYEPEAYFMEALRRDPKDMRCNLAMGNLMLQRGCFEKAEEFYNKSIERLTWRNDNPADTEALYKLGLTQLYMGKTKDAYNNIYRSVWSYEYASAGYYQLALMDAANGLYADALEKLELCLKGNADDRNAHIAKACMLRLLGRNDEALTVITKAENFDPIDACIKIEKSFITGNADGIGEKYCGKAEYFIDAARMYIRCGLYNDALRALKLMPCDNALVLYYMAYCSSLMGDTTAAEGFLNKADACRKDFIYPAQLQDIAVLEYACKAEKSAFAHYLLGCLYYDRFRYEDAANEWEISKAQDEAFAPVHRNLALAKFDKFDKKDEARIEMERAFELDNSNDRIFYEYQQLLKNMDEQPDFRIKLYEDYFHITNMRDDCLLEYAVLLTQTGRLEDAVKAMLGHSFHTYEGGEGKVTKHHAWMHILRALKAFEEGDLAKAEACCNDALVYPKNYGEGKNFFVQENHIYYTLSKVYAAQGRTDEAKVALERATQTNAIERSEISYFHGCAKRELGDEQGAVAIFNEMLADGQKILDNTDLYGYFGVGSPTPMPFEYDQPKKNKINAYVLCAYAYEGLGETQKATEAIENVRALSPHHFLVHTFDNVLRK